MTEFNPRPRAPTARCRGHRGAARGGCPRRSRPCPTDRGGSRRLVRIPTDNPDRSLRTQFRHDPPVEHIAPGLQVVDVRDEEKNVHRLHGVEGRRKTRRGRCRRQRPCTRSRRPRRTPRTGAPAALRTWTTARGGLVVGRVAAVRHRGAAPVPRASEEQRDQGTRPRQAPPATSWC